MACRTSCSACRLLAVSLSLLAAAVGPGSRAWERLLAGGAGALLAPALAGEMSAAMRPVPPAAAPRSHGDLGRTATGMMHALLVLASSRLDMMLATAS